jgi:hypothetical protein
MSLRSILTGKSEIKVGRFRFQGEYFSRDSQTTPDGFGAEVLGTTVIGCGVSQSEAKKNAAEAAAGVIAKRGLNSF